MDYFKDNSCGDLCRKEGRINIKIARVNFLRINGEGEVKITNIVLCCCGPVLYCCCLANAKWMQTLDVTSSMSVKLKMLVA